MPTRSLCILTGRDMRRPHSTCCRRHPQPRHSRLSNKIPRFGNYGMIPCSPPRLDVEDYPRRRRQVRLHYYHRHLTLLIVLVLGAARQGSGGRHFLSLMKLCRLVYGSSDQQKQQLVTVESSAACGSHCECLLQTRFDQGQGYPLQLQTELDNILAVEQPSWWPCNNDSNGSGNVRTTYELTSSSNNTNASSNNSKEDTEEVGPSILPGLVQWQFLPTSRDDKPEETQTIRHDYDTAPVATVLLSSLVQFAALLSNGSTAQINSRRFIFYIIDRMTTTT